MPDREREFQSTGPVYWKDLSPKVLLPILGTTTSTATVYTWLLCVARLMNKLLFIRSYSVLLCWCKLLLIHGYSVSLCWCKNCCLFFLGYAQTVKACRVFVLGTIVYTASPKPHSWFTLPWWSSHMNISCKWPIAVWYFVRYPQFMHQLQFGTSSCTHQSYRPMYQSHFCTVFLVLVTCSHCGFYFTLCFCSIHAPVAVWYLLFTFRGCSCTYPDITTMVDTKLPTYLVTK